MRLTPRNNITSVDGLLGDVSLPVGSILESALEGKDVSVEEGEALFRTSGVDLMATMLTADELRRRAVSQMVTFVTVRNINFTNVCYMGCRFCAFAKKLEDPEAELMPVEEVAEKAAEARAAGATEVCMQGGLHPRIGGQYYVDIVRAIKARAPEIHVHAFSPFEVVYGAKKLRLSVEEFLVMLKEAGLDSIPGTAAEILDTDVRKVLTRDKLTTAEWVQVIKAAHRLGIPSTATIMYGHIDGPYHWARHIALLREIQKETGGFTEFVPLGFIHDNTPLYHDGIARPGPTGAEDLKMHAVGRIMLSGHIRNVQVSWPKLGPKFAQVCLNAGANDFGGTLMSEQISKAAGGTHGEYMAPEEFCRLVWDIGRIPARRSTTYDILEVYPPRRED